MEHNEHEIEEGTSQDGPGQGDDGQGGGQEQEMPHNDLMHDAPAEPEHHGSVMAIIAVIIVVLVISLGGLYFWGSKMDKDHKNDDDKHMMEEGQMEVEEEIIPEDDPITEELSEQSTSDNADDIEEDLLGTDLEDLDFGLDDIEAELGAALGEL